MPGVVIYATGSPILVDLEESLARATITLRAGVRNRLGDCFLSDTRLSVAPESLTAELIALPFLVPLFTPANRLSAVTEARSYGFTTAFSLIDPTVIRPRTVEHGEGFYANAGCTLGAASRFGAFVFINRGATVGHHVQCGDYVSIGPGAVIAGGVALGQGALIGAGATVLPNAAIGANAVIGAGAVVTKDIPSGCMAIGNPARVVKTEIPGHNSLTQTRNGAIES